MRWGIGLLCLGMLASPLYAGGSITYGYDDLGQLTASSISGTVNNGVGTSIGYDAAGNRTNYFASLSPSSYDNDSQAYFWAMTTQPDATRKGLINDLIVGLKADGLWAKIGWLSLLASHDAQAGLLNVKDPGKTLTAVNAPTFTTNRGYTGDGSTNYLDAGEGFAASGLYAQNSAFLAIWSNTAGSGTYRIASGNSTTQAGYLVSTDTLLIGFINSNTGMTGTITEPTGLSLITRTSSTASALYKNGSSIATGSSTSLGVSTGNMRALAIGSWFATGRQAVVAWGAGLNATEEANLYSRISTYLTAIGAN